MTGSLDIIKRLLGGGLVALLLTAIAHANMLTKVRAAASDDGAPLICCLTDQRRHPIIAAISPALLALLGIEEARSIQGGDPAAFEEDLLGQFGHSLYKVQRYAKAVAAYQSALEQATTIWHTGWTLYHLGKSYEALGLYGEAPFV
ncbi:MAG TPA: tetratricopeptide repeat protein [Alphaproteobacteria bacterium]|nr:tetratricopeptide repeat protein [Alphaproteobacteria bacterium]